MSKTSGTWNGSNQDTLQVKTMFTEQFIQPLGPFPGQSFENSDITNVKKYKPICSQNEDKLEESMRQKK